MRDGFSRRHLLFAALAWAAAPARAALPVLPKKNDGTWSAHPLWSVLRQTHLKVDANGIIHADFVPQVQKLAGKPITISGFIMPIGGDSRHHFILSRYSPECPFCPAGGPTETIEVFADQPVGATQLMVTLAGTLNIQDKMDVGLFYRLFHAKPV